MEITVFAFGQLAEITGASFSVHDVNDIHTLREKIAALFPQANTIPYQVAVNKKIIQGNTPINNNDTIALLPPFSGG